MLLPCFYKCSVSIGFMSYGWIRFLFFLSFYIGQVLSYKKKIFGSKLDHVYLPLLGVYQLIQANCVHCACKDFLSLKSLATSPTRRTCTNISLYNVCYKHRITPFHFQLDDNQPLEYLSEMRQVTIVFMNMVLDEEKDSTQLLQEIFEIVYSQTKVMHGNNSL